MPNILSNQNICISYHLYFDVLVENNVDPINGNSTNQEMKREENTFPEGNHLGM